MLNIVPILKSLLRNPIGPVLIIFQFSFSIAIISNAVFYIVERTSKIMQDTGIIEKEIIGFSIAKDEQIEFLGPIVDRDMEIIRSMPDVVDAAPFSSVPISGEGNIIGFKTEIKQESPEYYATRIFTTNHAVQTLGIKVIEGENFKESEINYFDSDSPPAASVALITKDLAEKLFPGESAVGKNIYAGRIYIIVGVVEKMMGIGPGSPFSMDVILSPEIEKPSLMFYLIRVNEEDRFKVLRSVYQKLNSVDRGRSVFNESTLQEVKRKTYENDYAMVIVLTVVVLLLMFVNALGIFGLTSFLVNQRYRTIGIRRALGATKINILKYFITEGIILVIVSGIIGAFLALLINSYIVVRYGFHFLPFTSIFLTVIVLLFVTLSAVFFPAMRASQVSPRDAIVNLRA